MLKEPYIGQALIVNATILVTGFLIPTVLNLIFGGFLEVKFILSVMIFWLSFLLPVAVCEISGKLKVTVILALLAFSEIIFISQIYWLLYKHYEFIDTPLYTPYIIFVTAVSACVTYKWFKGRIRS